MKQVVIIGGGPSGSLTALHALRGARERGVRFALTIIEAKAFQKPGAAGCNFCAGVITARTMERLQALGLEFPGSVLQRRINGFQFVSEGGEMVFRHANPGAIHTVFRGGGPRTAGYNPQVSFDSILLDAAQREGAVIIDRAAIGLRNSRNGMIVTLNNGEELFADFVVGAFGVNSSLAYRLYEPVRYAPPRTVSVCQSEVYLDSDVIEERFANRIAVFNLRDAAIRFLAITPKRNYLTLTAVGVSVKMTQLREYMLRPEIQPFVTREESKGLHGCHCHPQMPVSMARGFLSPHFLTVGDACASRYYKNGLGSAFFSAQAAAEAVIKAAGNGTSGFDGVYRGIMRRRFIVSNTCGRVLFFINDIIYKTPVIAEMSLDYVRREQRKLGTQGPMQGLMWSLFTGDRSYTAILRSAFHPILALRVLLWYTANAFRWFYAWLMKQASVR